MPEPVKLAFTIVWASVAICSIAVVIQADKLSGPTTSRVNGLLVLFVALLIALSVVLPVAVRYPYAR